MTPTFARDLRTHSATEFRATKSEPQMKNAPPGRLATPAPNEKVKNGKKRQDSGGRVPVVITTMLRTPGIRGGGDTAERLRRGLSPAQGPRTVDVMARDACFSRRQFHRLTLQALGEAPGAHQRRLRLDRAAWVLLTSRATILEIALETGWESHETFTRAFRTQFGVTPSGFRKDRGVTLPPSMRAAFSIAIHAAT